MPWIGSKKNKEYEASFLGKIRWFFWHIFCDYSASDVSQLNTIQKEIKVLKSQNQRLINYIEDALKERIDVNMTGFEECVGLRKKITLEELHAQWDDPNFKSEEAIDDAPPPANPTEVKKKWLIKYHPDRFPIPEGLTAEKKEEADIHRKRVIILNKVWENFLQNRKEENTSRASSSAGNNTNATTTTVQTLKI